MPTIEPPGRFLVRVAEDHVGVLAVRSSAEMVRDPVLAASFHHVLHRSVSSATHRHPMTLCGVKYCPKLFPDATGHLFSAQSPSPLPSPPPSAPDQPPPR